MLRFLKTLVTWRPEWPPKAEREASQEKPQYCFEETKAKAEQGDARAQVRLGLAYQRGEGVAKDEAEGVKWYRKAAEQGVTRAQAMLGFAYQRGGGVARDEAEGVNWLRKAAERGDTDAQGAMASAYYHGLGVAKDQAEAAKWAKRAAEQGDAWLQLSLGYAYITGEGVPKDDVAAYKWILLAGAADEHAREQIRIIEKRLTPEQRAEGQKLAREFKPVVEQP